VNSNLRVFAFSGRMPRRAYWMVLLSVMGLVLGGSLGLALLATAVPSPGLLTAMSILAGLSVLAVLWISLATTVKRLHDRDRSAWWILVFVFAPSMLEGMSRASSRVDASGSGAMLLSLAGTAISIWAIIELGFLRGTVGDNRFGPDPLDGPYAAGPAYAPPPNSPGPAHAPPPHPPEPPLRPTSPWRSAPPPEPSEPFRGHRMPLPGGRPPPGGTPEPPTDPDRPPPGRPPPPRYDPWRR
jgi:uncharacterized membrane protein YhaH (DUF805 family)